MLEAPSTTNSLERISILPGVGVLSVLSHIRYQPWFALAEFVDNSLQSFLDHRNALQIQDGSNYHLRVEIEWGDGRLTIRDNAAGIASAAYARAFRPAAPPLSRDGLNEFGMGMKSAACWFARKWSVRTSALGEVAERTVRFDLASIVADDIGELEVVSRSASFHHHYTELVLEDLQQSLNTRTLGKVKQHLASIYRVYLRSGELELCFNGEALAVQDVAVLEAPYFDRGGIFSDPTPREWRKEIDFDFGAGLRVHGFAALRAKGSTSEAGFALFRRNRVIQGGGDEPYRPEAIFRTSNSFASQRLFGELHLEGFEVSHTKDGFQWDDQEEAFLELLGEYLNAGDLPLLRQAENYRVGFKDADTRMRRVAQESTERTAEVVRSDARPVLERQMVQKALVEENVHTESVSKFSSQTVEVTLNGETWRVHLELTENPSVGDWLSVGPEEHIETLQGPRVQLNVRMALEHPFMHQFVGARAEHLEPIFRLAVALGLAEMTARRAGVKYAGAVRRNVNELLREALWKET